MAKERIQYFDILKGVAIFLVVMGHVLTMCIREIDNAFLFKLIERVHMPIFFFIAGYFSYKASFQSPNIVKRAIQLLLPFVIVSSLWVIYFPHSGLRSPLDSTFSGLYLSEWKNGYWFTLVLFEICLLYSIASFLLSRTNNNVLRTVFVVGLWLMLYVITEMVDEQIVNILSLSLVVKFYPVFFFGVLCRDNVRLYNHISSRNGYLTLAIILGTIFFYVSAYSWEFDWIGESILLAINIALTMCVALIAVRLAQIWSDKVYSFGPERNRMARTWTYLGKESLAIYLLHYFFLFPLTFMQQPIRDMGLGFVPCLVVSIVFAAAIVAVTLGVNYIISQSKLLSLLLTGKNQYGK